jgi:hypothetical integral membrane protein (TIGR02206 family)
VESIVTSEFQFLGTPHLTAMFLTVLIPLALAALVRKADSAAVTRGVCYLLGAILLTNEVGHWGYRLIRGETELFVQRFLPLHVCSLATFAITFTLFFQSQSVYGVAYFWGLAGTLNAIITPDVEVGFPEYRFFQYFVGHCGIVINVLFATWGLRMRPTLKSLFRAFLILNGYIIVIAGFNWMMDTNYLFICKPPNTKSPFFFAPWPWYIPVLEGVALVLFFIVYSPFLISDWIRESRNRRGS